MGNCSQNPFKTYITSGLIKKGAENSFSFLSKRDLKQCYGISKHPGHIMLSILCPLSHTFHRGPVVGDDMTLPALTSFFWLNACLCGSV